MASLELAVEINPHCSVARGSLGTILTLVGRTKEAIVQQQIAIRSNPRDPSIFFRFFHIGFAHYKDGQYATAIEWADRAIHRMPRWYFAHFVLAASHVALAQMDQAREAVRVCQEVLPEIDILDADRLPLKDQGRMAELRARLSAAGFCETARI